MHQAILYYFVPAAPEVMHQATLYYMVPAAIKSSLENIRPFGYQLVMKFSVTTGYQYTNNIAHLNDIKRNYLDSVSSSLSWCTQWPLQHRQQSQHQEPPPQWSQHLIHRHLSGILKI